MNALPHWMIALADDPNWMTVLHDDAWARFVHRIEARRWLDVNEPGDVR